MSETRRRMPRTTQWDGPCATIRRMRFKLGLVIGFVIGFAVGARAGKERYDKLVAGIRDALRHDSVQGAVDLTERSTRRTRAATGAGLVSAARTVRERAMNPPPGA